MLDGYQQQTSNSQQLAAVGSVRGNPSQPIRGKSRRGSYASACSGSDDDWQPQSRYSCQQLGAQTVQVATPEWCAQTLQAHLEWDQLAEAGGWPDGLRMEMSDGCNDADALDYYATQRLLRLLEVKDSDRQ